MAAGSSSARISPAAAVRGRNRRRHASPALLAGFAGVLGTVMIAEAHPHPGGGAHLHAGSLAQPQSAERRPLVPEMFLLEGAAREAIDVAWLTDDERRELRVFHGQWTRDDLADPRAAAFVAAERLDADEPSLSDAAVSPVVRADVLRRIGRVAEARDLIAAVDPPTLGSLRVHAECLADMGQHTAALDVLDRMAGLAGAALREERPADLVDIARGRMLAATLDGASAQTWRDIVSLLSKVHQQIDRLHWPALLTEAELMASKNRNRAAMSAYHAALALNPRSAEGWYGLGRLALRQFDFGGAGRAASKLMELRPGHPYALLILAEMRMIQDDPDGAAEVLDDLLGRHAGQRQAMALRVAAAALRYDADEQAAALAAWDEISPGAPQARLQAGRFLSTFRQYDLAREMLRAAIDQLPEWGEPRLTLGLMEMQAGRDDLAAAVLREAARTDPFNARLANSLALIEELQGYSVIETEHFLVRYREGEDAVLATMMEEPLEAMHAEIVASFGTEPGEKTIVELMPDHERFAVRITGMPRLFTIAACTGPVIAMEVPRDGLRSKHQGPFDWIRVMRHEYTHTVTLAATSNRIPHWLTEGAAVSMESAPRAWSDCLMLANAHRQGELFTLDEIKWGFVRPRVPQERAMAYAQSKWMLEFMTDRWGRDAVVQLLAEYNGGAREAEAIPAALGVDRDTFYDRFVAWAGEQVASWGLAHEPSVRQLVAARGAEILMEVPDEAAEGPGSTMDTMPAGDEGEGGGGPGNVGPVGPGGGMDGPGEDMVVDGEPEVSVPTRPVLDDTLLTQLLNEHPNHPDLLRLDLDRRISAGEPVTGVMAVDLQVYAGLRPLDPFPHRLLATAFLTGDSPEDAIPHLEFLDAREQRTGALARRLAELYRVTQRPAEALRSAERAVSFDPYDAPNRELAAAVAIEAGDLAAARGHVAALSLLEPDRDLHLRRLDAIDRLIAGG